MTLWQLNVLTTRITTRKPPGDWVAGSIFVKDGVYAPRSLWDRLLRRPRRLQQFLVLEVTEDTMVYRPTLCRID